MSLQVTNIAFTYGKRSALGKSMLRDISFELNKGEILGIAGRSGSGKSTLLQILNGVLIPDSGKVILDGQDINNWPGKSPKLHQRIAMVGQIPEKQLFARTVFEDIAFGPANMGKRDNELEDIVKSAMAQVGLNYVIFKDRSPFQLSGGQKRMAAIAGILAMQADYLLLDEPTAGLDREASQAVFQTILKLKRSAKCGIIMVSHNIEDLLEISDRLLILDQGKICVQGDSLDVIDKMEEMQEWGYLSQSRELLLKLKQRGLMVGSRVKSPEEAAVEIEKLLKEKSYVE